MPTGLPQSPNSPLTPVGGGQTGGIGPAGNPPNMPTGLPQSPNSPLMPASPGGGQGSSWGGGGTWGQGGGPYSGIGAGQMNFPQVGFGGLSNMLSGMNLGGIGAK